MCYYIINYAVFFFLFSFSVPPTILPGPTELTVTAGKLVTLPCMSDGVPEPTVTWQKDGTPLRLDVPGLRQQATGSLQIPVAKESDIGSYTCLVYNDAGRNTRTITLTVHSEYGLNCRA